MNFQDSPIGRDLYIDQSTRYYDDSNAGPNKLDKEITNVEELKPIWGWEDIDSTSGLIYSVMDVRSNEIPFNIGMAWGLTRASFIGVLACATPYWGMRNIINTEQLIYDLVRQKNPYFRNLPQRIWLRIDWKKLDNKPVTTTDIWTLVEDTSHSQYLRTHDVPDGYLLGFSLTIELDQCHDLDEFIDLFLQLVERIFMIVDSEIAFVINLVHSKLITAINASELLIERTKTTLSQRSDFPAIPVETMFAISANKQNSNISYDPLQSRWEGRNFSRFFEYIIEDFKDDINLRTWPFSNLLKAYQFLESHNKEFADRVISIHNLHHVMLDIDDIVTSNLISDSISFDNQLLAMVREYKPYLLQHVVGAYSKSTRLEARLASFLFACKPGITENNSHVGADMLLDSWLAGTKLEGLQDDLDKFSHEYAETIHGSISREMSYSILLALLRCGQSHKQTEKAIGLFYRLILGKEESYFYNQGSLLPKVISDIVVYATNQDTSKLFNAHDEQKTRYLARLRFNLLFPSEYLRSASTDFMELWWLLLSQQPTENNIMQILQLSPKKKAIFGLLDRIDWRDLKHDGRSRAKVELGRRQRQLYYR